MAGTFRDYTDQPGHITRGALATSGTATEPDIIRPPRTAQSFTIHVPAGQTIRIQRDGVADSGSSMSVTDTDVSGTLDSGKIGRLFAGTAQRFECSGDFAIDGGASGTSQSYDVHFSTRAL